jgi:glutathione S-transferase
MDLTKYPNIARFIKQVEAVPAYQQALAKGGAFTTL